MKTLFAGLLVGCVMLWQGVAFAASGVLLDVQGEGHTITKTFTVTDDAAIVYAYNCGDMGSMNFMVTVYTSRGAYHGLVANAINEKGKGTSYLHDRGTFYLKIGTACAWHVIVSQ